jgi:hypothetical protein
MSQWVERIRNHQVFTELSEIIMSLDLAKEASSNDAALVVQWDRANAVILHIKTVLDQTDPLLVVTGNLNNLSTFLQQSRGEINNFVSNRNLGHWTNAQAHLDNCLSQLVNIPCQSVFGIEDMRETATAYRTAVAGWMDAIKKDGDGIAQIQAVLQTRITEATTEITTQKQRLDNAIAAFQQQFSEAQQTRQTEFSVAEQARAQASKQNKKVRQEEFEAVEKQRKEIAKKASEDASKRHMELVTKLEAESKGVVEAMDKLKVHAQKVVGIISDTGMAYGYQKTANEERAEAAI